MFINLTNVFQTVSRTGLYMVLEKTRCPLKLMLMIYAFHDRMIARVVFEGDISEPFNLRCGVRQGCVMAHILIYLCVLLLLAFLSPHEIALHTTHDENLSN